MRDHRTLGGPIRIQWPEHFTNGGTGVTKFSAKKLPAYKKAIKEFGGSDIWIKGDAFHSNLKNLSAFWIIFRRIEKEMGL